MFFRDLKVIVLGNGRIGKTQICRRLRGESFEEDADSTHGIGVTSTEFDMDNGEEPAILNLWDFGGQDIYHGTHALFMRTRAVFLLVWTPQSEDGEHEHEGILFRNQPLSYWFEYIRHLGGAASPVIVVQNQCDGGRGERANLPVDPDQLRSFEDKSRLFTRIAYSAKDNAGRTRLDDALQQSVRALREIQGKLLVGKNRLVVWNKLRAWRDADATTSDEVQRRHRSIPFADFEAFCREQAVHDPATFAEFLHHAGMVWYRPGIFGDQMVLDQSWALKAIYAVFTREGGVYETLRRLRGRFSRSDLDTLLWGSLGLSVSDQHSLLELMEQSGICFAHRYDRDNEEKTEYIAPDLLPDGPDTLADEIAARWEPSAGEPLEAAFIYPFLSPSVARAVLSDLGDLAGSTALYWRYGLCLYDKESNANAIVDEVPNNEGYGGKIRARAKGTGAETLLAKLIPQIEQLNKRSGWAAQLVGRSLSQISGSDTRKIQPGTPPLMEPNEPEVYVSYAWARERQEPLVEALCEALGTKGLRICRDSTELQPGERISRYMERLSKGRCVVVVLSRAYLRSEYCMMELYRLYTNARQHADDFLRRIVPLVQDDALIGSPRQRLAHALHWKTEHDELDALLRKHGVEIIGAKDFGRFKLIGEFYRHVGDMLAYANDVVVPRDRPTLSHDNFAIVNGLIQRTIAELRSP
jgi:internalin A